MKFFLKTHAFFACLALLFSACGDDDTVDVSYQTAPITLSMPTDLLIASGNGRAEISFRVPNDDAITHVMVQWDNSDDSDPDNKIDATINELDRVAVVPGAKESIIVGREIDGAVGELAAGNYNFKVTCITQSSSGVITARSEDASGSKSIYDNTTYYYEVDNIVYVDQSPIPYNIITDTNNEGGYVEIYWSRMISDLRYVQLRYKDKTSGEYTLSEKFAIDDDNTITRIENVSYGSSYEFYSYFKPTDGMSSEEDIVEVASIDGSQVMDNAASSPTNVTVLPGYGRFRVRWMVPNVTVNYYTVVEYQRTHDDDNNPVTEASKKIQYGSWDTYSAKDLAELYNNTCDYYYDEAILINNRNTRYISGAYVPSGNSSDSAGGDWEYTRDYTHLPSGYYTVSIYNVKEGGAKSTPYEEEDSDGEQIGTTQNIRVYDASSFVRPVLNSVPIRDVNDRVTFSFINSVGYVDCDEITIEYTVDEITKSTTTASVTNTLSYFSTTGLTDAKTGTTFTYTSTFPASDYLLDEVVLAAEEPGDYSYIPEVAPNQPKSVETVSGSTEIVDNGEYTSQTPKIYVTWTPSDDDVDDTEIEAYRVYWYKSSGDTYKSDYLVIGTDIFINGEGKYEYTITENLDADEFYYVEVVSAAKVLEGLSNRTESERTEVDLRPETYGYDTYKEEVLEFDAVKNNGSTATIQWGDMDEDCVGVVVYYTMGIAENTRYPALADADYQAFGSGENTTPLVDAKEGSSFTYVAYYKPTDGENTVKVASDDQKDEIPAPVPVPQLSVTTSSGGSEDAGYLSNINLSWARLSDSEVVKSMYVRYYSTSSSNYAETQLSLKSTSITLNESDGIVAGTQYYIYLVTVNADGLTSESDIVEAMPFNDSYFDSSKLPVAAATIVTDDINQIKINWSNIDASLASITLYYPVGTEYGVYSASELQSGITINQSGSEVFFTYTGTFEPEGGVTSDGFSQYSIDVDGGKGMAVSSALYDIYLESGVYQIFTAKGLGAFCDIVSGLSNFTYTGNTLLTGGSISSWTKNTSASALVMQDIDMATVCGPGIGSWNPIGYTLSSAGTPNTSASYTGTFDGGGYTISNLYISLASSYHAFFHYGGAATIKNVKLHNIYSANTNSLDGSSNGDMGAGFVGRTNGTMIENCHITGDDSYIYGGRCIGGMIGGMTGGYIKDCTSTANVTSTYTSSQTGTGGMAGSITGDGAYISGCTNTGKIVAGGTQVGGIAGYSSYETASSITDCLNYGEIWGYNTTGDSPSYTNNVGGIVGVNHTAGTVSGCENYGYVVGASSVGGIVGNNAGGTITTSENNTAAVIDATTTAGGIAGTSSGTVNSSNNAGRVKASGNTVGGIVGNNSGYVGGNQALEYTNTGNISGYNNIGGIVGYNSSQVSYYKNTGGVYGNNNVGGIVGYVTAVGTVSNNENDADVYYVTDDGAGKIIGGGADGYTESGNTDGGSLYQSTPTWME